MHTYHNKLAAFTHIKFCIKVHRIRENGYAAVCKSIFTMTTIMKLSPIKVPDACEDCGDTKNGSHTCEDTPHRNTPHVWHCWGCKDGSHDDVQCAFEIAWQRVLNSNMCLCCESTDFASQSLMCNACNLHGRKHPEVMNYEPCDAGCGRTGTFSLTCQFCEASSPGCIGCGEPGYSLTFCSSFCRYGVYR